MVPHNRTFYRNIKFEKNIEDHYGKFRNWELGDLFSIKWMAASTLRGSQKTEDTDRD